MSFGWCGVTWCMRAHNVNNECDFLRMVIFFCGTCASNRATVCNVHTLYQQWFLVKCNCSAVCCCHSHKCHVISSVLAYSGAGALTISYPLTHSISQCAFITMWWRLFKYDSMGGKETIGKYTRNEKSKEENGISREWSGGGEGEGGNENKIKPPH